MTRVELLVAAGVLIVVCLLSFAGTGYQEQALVGASVEVAPFAALLPLKRYSFVICAVAVTLLGLLLEDGRRRSLAIGGGPGPVGYSRRVQ